MTAKIELIDLKKAFGKKRILDGVNLSIPKGQSTVIIGGSGTGKSVTLKCILGLMKPDNGEILIDGVPRRNISNEDFYADFGMLFQGGALFDSLSVWENVSFRILQTRSMSKNDAKELAVNKIRRVGLSAEVADLFPSELSGGMQKRVGLARAIATDPSVIFFDEPTTGLDPIMSGVINDLVRELVVELGATAVTITHDMTSVRKIADQVAMIHEGKVQWFGSVNNLDDSGDPYISQFISGSPEGPIEAIR